MQHHVDSLTCPILETPPCQKKPPRGEAKSYRAFNVQPIQPRNRGRRWRSKTQQTKKVATTSECGISKQQNKPPLVARGSCLLLLYFCDIFSCAFVRFFFVFRAMIHCSNMEQQQFQAQLELLKAKKHSYSLLQHKPGTPTTCLVDHSMLLKTTSLLLQLVKSEKTQLVDFRCRTS